MSSIRNSRSRVQRGSATGSKRLAS
jgi:hypothetical protein